MPRTRQVAKAKATEAAVRTAKAGSPAPVDAALQLVEALPVPMFVKSRDGRYLGVNRAWEEFFGVSRASFLGKQVEDLYPQNPAIAEMHLEMDGQLWRNPGGQSYEATVTARDGRLRDTIYYKATFANGSGQVAGLLGAIVDITARKQAEASLLESERRFRRTFELAGSGVAHIGMDRRFIRVNRRLCEILGYPQAELLRLTGRQISHPDDLDVINAQRPRLYAGEVDSVRVEKRYLRKDGSIVWVSFTMVVERDAAGKPQYEIAFYDDITARKHAEAALRESEERFRSVVDSANEGILVYDKQLNVVAGNLAAERERGALPADFRARDRRHRPRRSQRPLHEGEPPPVRDPGLRRAGAHLPPGEGDLASRGPQPDRFAAPARAQRREAIGALREALPQEERRHRVGRPVGGAGVRRERRAAIRDRAVRRHHRAQEGRGGAARGARGAEALERRARAVRLCRLARPAGAAAHGVELHPAPHAPLR